MQLFSLFQCIQLNIQFKDEISLLSYCHPKYVNFVYARFKFLFVKSFVCRFNAQCVCVYNPIFTSSVIHTM